MRGRVCWLWILCNCWFQHIHIQYIGVGISQSIKRKEKRNIAWVVQPCPAGRGVGWRWSTGGWVCPPEIYEDLDTNLCNLVQCFFVVVFIAKIWYSSSFLDSWFMFIIPHVGLIVFTCEMWTSVPLKSTNLRIIPMPEAVVNNNKMIDVCIYSRSWISGPCRGDIFLFPLSEVRLIWRRMSWIFTMFFDLRKVLCLSLPPLLLVQICLFCF